MIKKIVIVGPESTGKSSLSKQLADHYKTIWVEEYAREYLTAIARSYTFNDIIEIYKEQFRREQELIASSSKYLFIDTEFIIAKVWCESAFQCSSQYVEDMIDNYPYDLYLLTAPDLPWEYDPLRENPGKGDYFFNWYKTLLLQKGLKHAVVSGAGITRIQNAISIMEDQKW